MLACDALRQRASLRTQLSQITGRLALSQKTTVLALKTAQGKVVEAYELDDG
jgi:hypothetical protein